MNTIKPFTGFSALDGCHCQTNSLAKIFDFYGHPLSEEMLLGLGSGMGFIYWQQKGVPPFVGGRGNTKAFFNDIGQRTGVVIEQISTTSEKKAQSSLLEVLERREPMMLFGDMGLLPWFDFPENYHFGGHTFVACGYDGGDQVLCSDIDPKQGGVKKGFTYAVTLEQLRKARSSPHKPFPPGNAYLEFDFSAFRPPRTEDIDSAIAQTVDGMLDPPISNFGIAGIRRTAKEIQHWPDRFNDFELRMNLFTLYIFIEIGGTGGGCFRYMYARFLKQATTMSDDPRLSRASERIEASGRLFTRIGLMFQDAENSPNIEERIPEAADLYLQIADLEEGVYRDLRQRC